MKRLFLALTMLVAMVATASAHMQKLGTKSVFLFQSIVK